MKKINLNFLCNALDLPIPEQNITLGKITTDSRHVQKGDVFFALIGENHDAHDFVPQVLEKGAFAVVSRSDCASLENCLVVSDTLIALQKLSAAWRNDINPFVFGITGSSGKTTVKEMLATILRSYFGEAAVLATSGNLNNHIGLPLTLLNLNENHRFAVIEMGMNHAGELAQLTRLACPNVALVNNAMRAHIGCGFNGVEDIARAKSEIYQGLKENGVAIVPIEDPNLAIFMQATQQFIQKTFGVEHGDVHAEQINLQAFSSDFQLSDGVNHVAVHLPVAGRHNIANACAAAALAQTAGLTLIDISRGLANFKNIKGRLQIKQGKYHNIILDDTYNANPDSMKAALDVLAQLPEKKIFIMGDMGELGEKEAAAMHAEIGAYAKNKQIHIGYFIGENSLFAAQAFGNQGYWFENKEQLMQALQSHNLSNAAILVKGSRFMKMEQIVTFLIE